jgi:hypothetical protein
VHGIAKLSEQVEPALPLRRVRIIDSHLVEEGVDRLPQRCENFHRPLEILLGNSLLRPRLRNIERLVEFGFFGQRLI